MIALLAAALAGALVADSVSFIRVNQVGYLPDAPKIAVVCSLEPARLATFTVRDARGREVLRRAATGDAPFGPCVTTHRLDFSAVRSAGTYTIAAGSAAPASRLRCRAGSPP